MCGIAGIVNLDGLPVLPARIKAMTDRLRHRGPDGEGYVFLPANRDGAASFWNGDPENVPENFGDAAFGHRRLAIIDLERGGQPMSDPSGRVWLTYNGEVYNYRELRGEMVARGVRFRTNSDTEVVLQAYMTWGDRAFARLNGIFAFGIWDGRDRNLRLVRDPYGVKFVYYHDGDQFAFASEIRALLAASSSSPEVDATSLLQFLTYRYVPSPRTMLDGVRKVPPGHLLRFHVPSRSCQVERYDTFIPEIDSTRDEGAWIEELRATLRSAVRRQMVSDVPIASVLSGGVDSGVVTRIMMEESTEPVRSYTVGFDETWSGDELGDAGETAERLGTRHIEVRVSPEAFVRFLPHSVYANEEPAGTDSAIPFWFLCRRVGQDVKVALTGQGADEPFAGYRRYIGEKLAGVLGPVVSNPVARQMLRVVRRPEWVGRAAASLGERDTLRRFLAIYALFNRDQLARVIPRIDPEASFPSVSEPIRTLLARVPHLDHLSQMLFVDARCWLPDDFLLYGDKMSMASSVEARIPFLDHELMHLAESIPSSLKLKGLRKRKYIHKRAAEAFLPKDFIHRPKRGFYTPVDQWFRTSMGGLLKTILLGDDARCPHYLSANYVKTMIEEHRAGRCDHQRRLFALLSFEMWHRMFVDGCEPEELSDRFLWEHASTPAG